MCPEQARPAQGALCVLRGAVGPDISHLLDSAWAPRPSSYHRGPSKHMLCEPQHEKLGNPTFEQLYLISPPGVKAWEDVKELKAGLGEMLVHL